jgi:hypothetical protein
MTGREPHEYRRSRLLGRLGRTNSEAFSEGKWPVSVVIGRLVFGLRLPDGELPNVKKKGGGLSGVKSVLYVFGYPTRQGTAYYIMP